MRKAIVITLGVTGVLAICAHLADAAKLEHPIRDNGISVSFDNLEFHMNLLLHSVHLYFLRWG